MKWHFFIRIVPVFPRFYQISALGPIWNLAVGNFTYAWAIFWIGGDPGQFWKFRLFSISRFWSCSLSNCRLFKSILNCFKFCIFSLVPRLSIASLPTLSSTATFLFLRRLLIKVHIWRTFNFDFYLVWVLRGIDGIDNQLLRSSALIYR